LSDHTINNNACFAATALGASILERHFTDTKNRKGPDIICSADKEELKKLIDGTNEIFLMRGGSKIPLPEEKVTIDFAYATIVSIAPLNNSLTLFSFLVISIEI
jgi:sialic acid synthase SpsE